MGLVGEHKYQLGDPLQLGAYLEQEFNCHSYEVWQMLQLHLKP